MIKSVTVINPNEESIKMVLSNPWESGFAITDMSGIGPGKADVNVAQIATDDGGLFNFARIGSRNIVLTIKLLEDLEDKTIETTRHKSYRYFPLKKRVILIFETNNRTIYIVGYVESNEPDIFSESESIQVSIICPDPFFYSYGDSGKQVTVFNGVEKKFRFPFSNKNPNVPKLIMGTLKMMESQNIEYEGDADVGIIIIMEFIGTSKMITIYNTGTREQFKIDTELLKILIGRDIHNGDTIVITTVKGNKSIIMYTAEGEVFNILNAVEKNPAWFTLSKGSNQFAYLAEEGSANIQFRIENRIVYEGV